MKENVLNSLTIMWKGMLAIFIVIGLIMAAVWLLKFFDKRTAKKKAAQKTAESSSDVADLKE